MFSPRVQTFTEKLSHPLRLYYRPLSQGRGTRFHHRFGRRISAGEFLNESHANDRLGATPSGQQSLAN